MPIPRYYTNSGLDNRRQSKWYIHAHIMDPVHDRATLSRQKLCNVNINLALIHKHCILCLYMRKFVIFNDSFLVLSYVGVGWSTCWPRYTAKVSPLSYIVYRVIRFNNRDNNSYMSTLWVGFHVSLPWIVALFTVRKMCMALWWLNKGSVRLIHFIIINHKYTHSFTV